MNDIFGIQKMAVFFQVFIFTVMAIASGVQAVEPDIFHQPVTAKFHEKELDVIFKQLSEDAGIQIIYDEKISKKIVSGLFEDTSFLKVIQRLLGGENHSLTMNHKRRVMLVKGFGKSHYVSTGIKPNGKYLTDIGIPLDELKALHAKQTEEYVRNSNNMDEFLSELGMTRGELRDLHEKQTVQFEKEGQDPNQYLAELSMTRGQLQIMREKQLTDYNRELNNDNTVLPETGLTQGEQRGMLHNQALAFEKRQNDDSEFMSEIGMTRGEHKLLLAHQLKKFENRLTP